MESGHLNACRYAATGNPADCKCASEERHYLRLAKWSFWLFVFEFLGGLFSHSLALLSDALHVLLDGSENIVSAVVSRLARKGKNEERIRSIGGLVSGCLLLVIAGVIIREGWERSHEPQEVSGWMLLVAVIGLGINLWQRKIHQEAPDEHRNVTHFWQDWHLLSDIATSGVVIVGGILMITLGWYWLDGILSIAIGGWIAILTVLRLSGVEIYAHHH